MAGQQRAGGLPALQVRLFWTITGLRERYHRWNFRAQVALGQGSARAHPAVRFAQRVTFQGAGRLVAEQGVVFGARLGGAVSLPILIQPRTPDARIRIGAGTHLANGSELIACLAITIGRHCRIGARTLIVDSDFHGLAPAQRDQPGRSAPVRVGNNVWIGANAIVLKGVTIGDDAVVGAGCVVTRDVPRGAVAAGNPMRVVGSVYDR